MSAIDAVEFMIKDHGDLTEIPGFREDFAEDRPIRSILQRNDKTLDEILDLFDWKEDSDSWYDEYTKDKGQDVLKLMRYRRRVAFCVGGWREFNEDFGRGDVSCLRDIRTPLVTSRSPLKAAKDEFDGGADGK
jgi:hypothetical protein